MNKLKNPIILNKLNINLASALIASSHVRNIWVKNKRLTAVIYSQHGLDESHLKML